jgi:hypothetical protein
MEKPHEQHENNGDRNKEDVPAGAMNWVEHVVSDPLGAMNESGTRTAMPRRVLEASPLPDGRVNSNAVALGPPILVPL